MCRIYAGRDGKPNANQSVVEALLRLVKNHAEMEKQARSYGTDVQIHKAEINMIATIAANPGIHIGGLAALLDITKGSVSEIVNKLVKKGLVIKKADAFNLSKLSLALTAKGELANDTYANHQKEMNSLVEETLETSSEEEIHFLMGFLSALSVKLNGNKNSAQ